MEGTDNIAAVEDIADGTHLDERVFRVLLTSDIVVASLARVKVGAL